MAGVAMHQIQVATYGEAPGLNSTRNMDIMDQLVIIILMVHIILQFRLPSNSADSTVSLPKAVTPGFNEGCIAGANIHSTRKAVPLTGKSGRTQGEDKMVKKIFKKTSHLPLSVREVI